MKRILIACFVSLLLLANCQKKEEPKVRTPYPAGPVQGENEIALLQDIVRKDPKNVGAWIKLGNILMDTHRFQGAIDAYQKAIEMDPKNVDVRVDMGTCYRNTGRPDRAVEEYRKALAINPRHLNAHRNLGIVLAFDLGDKKQAIKEFEEYLRLSPNAPDADQLRQETARLKAAQ
ncbi:MAG TPA: tetratricopeptide repeat protein [Thermodesulfovibrionales bacterium]|nr:tetratricopeptide repeat protein [Thermodesulfovibrionales bacterium]